MKKNLLKKNQKNRNKNNVYYNYEIEDVKILIIKEIRNKCEKVIPNIIKNMKKKLNLNEIYKS